MAEWITVSEAAQILGVHPSAIPKMIRRGDLRKREERPILARADVEALRDARAAVEAARAAKRAPRGPRPPDTERTWLRAASAAAVLDSTSVAVMARARRGRLPSTLHDGARWFALEHLVLVERAIAAKRTTELSESPTVQGFGRSVRSKR